MIHYYLLPSCFSLQVGDILKCIDSSPQVCDRRSDSHLQYSISSSSSSRKWIKCENWFGVIGLVNISSVRVIDNSNELAYYLEARPRVKALYTFDKETDEDLALSVIRICISLIQLLTYNFVYYLFDRMVIPSRSYR